MSFYILFCHIYFPNHFFFLSPFSNLTQNTTAPSLNFRQFSFISGTTLISLRSNPSFLSLLGILPSGNRTVFADSLLLLSLYRQNPISCRLSVPVISFLFVQNINLYRIREGFIPFPENNKEALYFYRTSLPLL